MHMSDASQVFATDPQRAKALRVSGRCRMFARLDPKGDDQCAK